MVMLPPNLDRITAEFAFGTNIADIETVLHQEAVHARHPESGAARSSTSCGRSGKVYRLLPEHRGGLRVGTLHPHPAASCRDVGISLTLT